MISVIIPAYNEEKYIEKTLKSIKKQLKSRGLSLKKNLKRF